MSMPLTNLRARTQRWFLITGVLITACAGTSGCLPKGSTPERDVAPEDDAATTATDTPITLDVLANDGYSNPPFPQVIGVTQGSDGLVAINPDWTITYTPNLAFNGTDSFSYTIRGLNDTATATVTVLVTPNPLFGPKTDYITGFLPWALAIGDLNDDGKLDLAVAITSPNIVSILFQDPGVPGNFLAPLDMDSGANPSSVAIGDLDGDGLLDLAITNSYYNANAVSVIFQNPSSVGTFLPATSFGVGQYPSSVGIGDFNNDGLADLAVTNSLANSVSVLIQDSGIPGSFLAKTDFAVQANPRSLAVGDLNGDGLLDLAIANSESASVSVLFQDPASSGSFLPAFHLTVGFAPRVVAIGDLDGDGQPDLAVACHASDFISVLLQVTGTPGVFSMATSWNTAPGPITVAIGDIDLDGKRDLVVAHSEVDSDSIAVLLQDGISSGTFLPPTNFVMTGNPWSISIDDLDGDGKLDLVAGNSGADYISVLLGR